MKIKSFLKRKYIIWAIITLLILIAIWFLFFKNSNNENSPFVVHSGEFVNQISVSGKITANENVNLSFEQPGIIRSVYAKVGDKVGAGKLIASQDTAQLHAQAAQMQAGIELQKAKLNQLLAGSAPQDIKIKEDAVLTSQQDLQNAYATTLSYIASSYNAIYNAYNTIVYTKNTYFTQQDQAGAKLQQIKFEASNSLSNSQIALESAQNNNENSITAIGEMTIHLNAVYDNLKIIRELANEGIYYASVSTTDKTALDTQRTNINTALTNILSSKESIVSDKAAVLQAENELQAIKATPRQTDTAVYDAQIKQAEASLQEIFAQIRKKQVISPISGIITLVNAKVGSIMSSTEIAASIIGNGKFQIGSYVPEIYIASVKIGNTANITLDAYGLDTIFAASVVSIDPSQTQKDGVATYKTTLQFTSDDKNLKDGMSANVVIITNKKENVISIPQGLLKIKDGKKIVTVKNGENIIEKEVQIGDISSSGQVEIISGLNEGDILPL